MKRILCLFLCLLFLCGCSARKSRDTSTAFYYCRMNSIITRTETSVVAERREVSADSSDLKNLLSLYLMGPQEEELVSPFQGMKLSSVQQKKDQLFIELTCSDKSLTDIRFSLASACMAMTCLELLDTTQITITCGSRSVTMTGKNLLLTDTVTPIETATEETK